MTRYLPHISGFFLTVLLGACATPPRTGDAPLRFGANDRDEVAISVEDCRERLEREWPRPVAELAGSTVRLLNWNIKKGLVAEWQRDLDRFSGDRDLITIQEAVLEPEMLDRFDGTRHWSFAKGYVRGASTTGVATIAPSQPLTECHLVVVEPWLRTPKAINVTEYALADSNDTLVVVNVHAINFTLGVERYRDQIKLMTQVLDAHAGPVIVSGDLNTWSDRRIGIVDDFAAQAGLKGLSFESDDRTTMFGHQLDHVYFRGVELVAAEAHAVKTSDHNPILAEFRL